MDGRLEPMTIMPSETIAEWVEDGFLHPPDTLISELVDVDDFVRIPVAGLSEIVQFARVMVRDRSVIVFQPNGAQFGSVLRDYFGHRHPEARPVFLSSSQSGKVRVQGEDLSEVEALAVAVTELECAWLDSAQIDVRDDRHRFLVTVAYRNDRYPVSAQIASTEEP